MTLVHSHVGIFIATGVVAAILCVIWYMRRLSLRGQFLALLVMAVSMGFLFLTIVQVPEIPHWLALSLVIVVFVFSPFAVRNFMRSLLEDDEQQQDDGNAHKHVG
ncbi:MAG: hypothetical protein WCA98_07390 [Candidatus Acidiferrales bacterium]